MPTPPLPLAGDEADDGGGSGVCVRVVGIGVCEDGCDWLDDGSVDDSSIPPPSSLDMLELNVSIFRLACPALHSCSGRARHDKIDLIKLSI
jgi:hypothetical protein